MTEMKTLTNEELMQVEGGLGWFLGGLLFTLVYKAGEWVYEEIKEGWLEADEINDAKDEDSDEDWINNL